MNIKPKLLNFRVLMTHAEHLQPSYPTFNNMETSFNENQDLLFSFSPELTITNSSHMSSISNFHTIFSDHLAEFSVHVEDLNIMDAFSLDLEEFEDILSDDIEEKDKISSPLLKQVVNDDMVFAQPSLVLPQEEMDIENLLALAHLVKAYGEAIENKQRELAEVLVKCIVEKVSPIGDTIERLLYYLYQPSDKNSIYLKQESAKNFISAFKAFSMLLPYAKFAYFAANSAILESMSRDNMEVMHIVDFDIGEGTQWSSLIEEIGCKGREVKITSIKWPENSDSTQWRFEETKKRLVEYSRIFGLKLDIDEVELNDLAIELKKGDKMGGKRKKLVFNCMVGLMGRVRSLRHVLEFLKTAKEMVKHSPKGQGVLTFGDGEFWEVLKSCSSFTTYLDGCVIHYQALLESMEYTFPSHLGDARTAIECLFVSPFVSSLVWAEKWEDRKLLCDLWLSSGLDNCRVTKESLVEAKEMMTETNQGVSSPYAVVVEGGNNNEMVLKWSGVQLVRVSFWGS